MLCYEKYVQKDKRYAGTICDGTLTIKDGDCVKISYPEFYENLYSLGK